LNLPEGELYGADIALSYDTAVVSATVVVKGALATGWSMASNLTTPGVVRVAMAGATPIATSGELLLFVFDGVGSAGSDTDLTLTRGDLNEGGITTTLEHGCLSIQFPTYTASQPVSAGDPPSISFPNTNVTLDFSVSLGGTVTVTMHTADHPNPPGGISVMSKYWDITADFSSGFTVVITFTYDEDDLNGASESDIAGAARWDDANARWEYIGGTVDTDANTVTLTDIHSFSPWLLITSSPPAAVADLAGTRSGNDLQLSWSAVTQDILGNAITPDHYTVYRKGNDAYFSPTASDAVATPTNPSHTDAGALGDPSANYFYAVTTVDAAGKESAISNRFGEFDFALSPGTPGGEKKYNLIALDLEVSGVTDADSLASYAGSGAYMVIRYDAPTQSIVWRLPGLAGTNFPVQVGEPYFLYLDDTASNMLSLVGGVPSKGSICFTLTKAEPGGSCKYNFITVPLDRSDLTDADTLAADIGGVYMVIRYNAETQDLTWRLPGLAGENFPVRPGYPYIICLNENAPAMWP
jgi:hypothetical protein